MVYFDNKTRSFHLRTQQSSYVMAINETGHILNLYFGKRLAAKHPYENLMPPALMAHPNQTSYSIEAPEFVEETSCLEYSHPGKGDYRDPSCILRADNGEGSFDFVYQDHRLLTNKPEIEGLPSAEIQNSNEPITLEITLKDRILDVELCLSYTTSDDCDVICRNVSLTNNSNQNLQIEKIMSACLDRQLPNWQILTLDGAWSRERHAFKRPISPGRFSVHSRKGTSSSDHSPFIVLASPETTEYQGEAIGLALVYSGNHSCSVELSPHGITRVQTGINPETFTWSLPPGTQFQSPEALISYSGSGLNILSQNFHRLVNNHIVPERWRAVERPVLVNNWEATYFDFDEKELLGLAKDAAALGVELFVLDDGWFGKRNDDTSSLGDWFVNQGKIPGGLKKLADRIRGCGLKFGLWVEPEMISIESRLYRDHPEWMVQSPGRSPSPARNQYLLDMANPLVGDYIFDTLSQLFSEAEVSYVKWDMNRNFSDAFSPSLPPERQGEFTHRYVLGLYKLLTRFVDSFPQILFEACAAGGNRYDLGMLSYMPQIWTSDDSDAGERLAIQEGTSFFSPLSAMGAHVSDVPNHQTLRTTPLETRFNVAAFGILGYEMDLTRLTRFEQKVIRKQIAFYKANRTLLQFGRFYRLAHPESPNGTAWIVVSGDKGRAILGIYQKLSSPNPPSLRIKLAGLDPDAMYKVDCRTQYIDLHSLGKLASHALPVKLDDRGRIFDTMANRYLMPLESFSIRAGGDQLMSAGLCPPQRFHGGGYADGIALTGDFASRLYVLNRVSPDGRFDDRN